MTNVAALYVDPRGPYPRLLGAGDVLGRGARCADVCGAVARRRASAVSQLGVAEASGDGRRFGLRSAGGRAGARLRRSTRVSRALRSLVALRSPASGRASGCLRRTNDRSLPGGLGTRRPRKRTWLYLVEVAELGPKPTPREPTHWCSGFRSSTHASPKRYRTNGCAVPPGIKVCSAQQRRRTPVAFAEWLIALARQASR